MRRSRRATTATKGRTSKKGSDPSSISALLTELEDSVRTGGGAIGAASDINRLGKREPYLPTGFFYLDREMLRRGGLPRGKLVHIWGGPRSCKSLFLYRLIASCQRLEPDRSALLIDTEDNAGPDLDIWLEAQGVDTKKLILLSGARARSVFNTALKLIKSGNISICGFDSIGNLIPNEQEIAKKGARVPEDDESGMMEAARVISDKIKRLGEAAKTHETFLVAINQVRDNIGVMYGDKKKYPGGWCLEHNVKVGFQFTRVKDIEEGEDPVGMIVKCKLDRSKISPAGKSTTEHHHLQFLFDKPSSDDMTEYIFDSAVREGVLTVAGAWIKWEDRDLKWQGREKALEAIKEDGELLESIQEALGESTSAKKPAGRLKTVNLRTLEVSED